MEALFDTGFKMGRAGILGRDNQDGTVASIRMGLGRGWPDGARAQPERRTASPGGAFFLWVIAVGGARWRS